MAQTNKALRRVIMEKAKELSPEEVFTSPEMQEHLTKVASGCGRRYGTAIVAVVVWSPQEDWVAYTDGNTVHVNAGSKIFDDFGVKTVGDRYCLIIGLIVHEAGHILFTDFSLSRSCMEGLAISHELTPMPDGACPQVKAFLDQYPAAASIAAQMWHQVENSIEDGRMENLVLPEIPGYGIYLGDLRKAQFGEWQGAAADKAKGLDKLARLLNLVLMQAKYGQAKGMDFQDEVTDMFDRLKPLIDRATAQASAFEGQKLINEVFETMITMIIDEMLKSQQKPKQPQQGSGQSGNQQGGGQSGQDQNSGENRGDGNDQPDGGSGKQDGEDSNSPEGGKDQQDGGKDGSESQSESGEGGQPSKDDGGPQDSSESGRQSGSSSGNGEDSSSSASSNGQEQGQQDASGAPSAQPDLSSLVDAMKKAVEEGEKHEDKGDTMSRNDDSPKGDRASGEVKKPSSSAEGDSNASDSDEAADAAARQALNDLCRSIAQREVEAEIQSGVSSRMKKAVQDAERDAGKFRIGSRMSRTAGSRNSRVDTSGLDKIARKMAKEFLREIKDRQLGDTVSGYFYGNVLSVDELYRRDRKVYSKKTQPEDLPDMECCILIDASGSMEGEKLFIAQKTAYIVCKFCESLQAPVSVVAHDANGVVNLQVAVDAGLPKNDIRRVFDIKAGCCNRDGFAVRSAADMLRSSPASQKLLLVISDGCPSEYRSIEEADEDVRTAVADAKKAGITVLTAGIGSDAENIREVWLDGMSPRKTARFVEIPEDRLERLPKIFVKAIKDELK